MLYWCNAENGGGGSSTEGKFGAFGLREEKLVGAPMGSGPGTIEGGNATAAATFAVRRSAGVNG